MTLAAYIEACEERYAFDAEYRARLQKELFDTDTQRSILQTLEDHRMQQMLGRKIA